MRDENLVEELYKDYIFFSCIRFINSVSHLIYLSPLFSFLKRTSDQDCIITVAFTHVK